MLVQLMGSHYGGVADRATAVVPRKLAQPAGNKIATALEGIGSRRTLARNRELFAEGDIADCWFRVISGTVRMFKFLADGRRPLADFYVEDEWFGLDNLPERLFSAETVTNVTIIRYPRCAAERLIDESPELAQGIRQLLMQDLVNAHRRMLLLGRTNAPERVAAFLLDICIRRKSILAVDLPMSRNDIADYLGLTIETVSRVFSALKRDGIISIPSPHRIELHDRRTLASMGNL